MERKIKSICNSSCTGCSACYNICPVDAITMEENNEGFLVPVVNKEICIDCGMCDKKCPILNKKEGKEPPKAVYAAWAKDDIRLHSSSGGIFTVLAEKVIREGGVVVGASFEEDFLSVKHIIVDNITDLNKLRGSKYVQSRIGDIFKKIKELLGKGKKVLFTGTPCQVGGLLSYLGKEYDDLITIDILCHGVPSPKAYKKFVQSEILNKSGSTKIVDFSFRKKEIWGWAHSLYAKTENGYEYNKSKSQTPWYESFLNILNCRKSCGECQFNKIPRPGDITLGDFWGLEEYNRNLDDKKGASIVAINSEKGELLYNSVASEFKHCERITLEIAKNKNGNLVGSSKNHKERKRFFELLDMYDDYEKITQYASKRKFDIGYVGWWYGKNYGSVLTNYALHEYLKSKHYSVLMLDWPEKIKPTWPIEDNFARRFGNKHYEIGMRRTYDELKDLNYFCDMFVVGSDQLWNYWSTKENGAYFFLDFVDDSKKKIAYATSFGHPIYGAPDYIAKDMAYHMNRIDYVSVRESDGINICKDTFGVDAVQNIDPVFLIDESKYSKLVDEAIIQIDQKYIFAYILSPTEEKRNTLLELSKRVKLPVVLVLDAQADYEKNRMIMNMPESLKENIELEDWLSLIKKAEMVVTDSYHGACFSLIFKKKFVCFANIKRGISRFLTLFEKTGLMGRMFYEPEKCLEDKHIYDEIDYGYVWKVLNQEIERSKYWLDNALSTRKINKTSTYDMLMRRINELEKKLRERTIL